MTIANQNRGRGEEGVEDMEFPGVLKKKASGISGRGLIKNDLELRGMIKEESCGISKGLGFRP